MKHYFHVRNTPRKIPAQVADGCPALALVKHYGRGRENSVCIWSQYSCHPPLHIDNAIPGAETCDRSTPTLLNSQAHAPPIARKIAVQSQNLCWRAASAVRSGRVRAIGNKNDVSLGRSKLVKTKKPEPEPEPNYLRQTGDDRHALYAAEIQACGIHHPPCIVPSFSCRPCARSSSVVP